MAEETPPLLIQTLPCCSFKSSPFYQCLFHACIALTYLPIPQIGCLSYLKFQFHSDIYFSKTLQSSSQFDPTIIFSSPFHSYFFITFRGTRRMKSPSLECTSQLLNFFNATPHLLHSKEGLCNPTAICFSYLSIMIIKQG